VAISVHLLVTLWSVQNLAHGHFYNAYPAQIVQIVNAQGPIFEKS